MSKVCTKCNLYLDARNICVRSRGVDNPLILFVGEAPGREDDRKDLSFVGAAGQKLDELMLKTGLDQKWCRFGNINRCVPWENEFQQKVRPPTEEEIDACCGYLEAEIQSRKPVFIVPLGKTAASYFLGKCAISKVRGRRHLVELPTLRYRYLRMHKLMSLVFDDKKTLKKITGKTPASRERAIDYAIEELGYEDVETKTEVIFPTFHPAAVLYGNPVEMEILADLNYLVGQITGTVDDAFKKYKLITSLEELATLVQKLLAEYSEGKIPWLSVDVETSSLDPYGKNEILTTIGITSEAGNGWCIPFNHRESPFKGDRLALSAIRNLLNTLFSIIPVIGHNFKFDYKWLYTRGIFVKKIAGDTELSSWTLFNAEVRHDLESLTTKYTDLGLHKSEMREAQDNMPDDEKYNTDNYSLDLVSRYNCLDTDATFRLNEVFNQMMKDQKLYPQHQHFAVKSVIPTAHMEMNGCKIDLEVMERMDIELTQEMQQIYDNFREWGLTEILETERGKKFKITSPEAVSMLLYNMLGFKPTKYGKVRKNGPNKGQAMPSSDRLVLHSLKDLADDMYKKTKDEEWKWKSDVVDSIIQFKKKTKIHTGYVKSIPAKIMEDGFCHPSYGIRHTNSGRFNCRSPSLHTIPYQSDTKKAFISRFHGGLITNADFSQMELRVLAMASGDLGLLEAFTKDQDIHTYVSARVLKCREDEVPKWERHKNKQILFGMIYGRTALSISKGLTQYTDMFENMTEEAAQQLIDSVFEEFPKVKEFIEAQHKYVERHGQIWSLAGFRRFISIDGEGGVGKAHRRSVNTPIQGCASDLCVSSMCTSFNKAEKIGFKSLLYQFIHDSLCWDTVPGELYDLVTLLKKEMVEAPPRMFDWCNVPLKADFEVGVSWGHLVKLQIVDGANTVKFSGNPDSYDLVLERFKDWPEPPQVISREDSINSLKEPYVESIVQFAPRNPQYDPIYNA